MVLMHFAGRRCARSTRAALASTPADATVWREAMASTLAVATLWREAARVLPRSAAAWLSPCSLYVGCAGFHAGGRHVVARTARVLPRPAVAWPSPCSLYAGCAGFHAGGRHDVAQGGTCAASGSGGLALAVFALRGLRWHLRWRSPWCGAGRRVCCLGRRLLDRRRARSTRAALASTLAVATLWREAARVLPRAAAA